MLVLFAADSKQHTEVLLVDGEDPGCLLPSLLLKVGLCEGITSNSFRNTARVQRLSRLELLENHSDESLSVSELRLHSGIPLLSVTFTLETVDLTCWDLSWG
eukprot:scaffold747_cov120-Cylindrotheca_fusiformis.AAC.7